MTARYKNNFDLMWKTTEYLSLGSSLPPVCVMWLRFWVVLVFHVQVTDISVICEHIIKKNICSHSSKSETSLLLCCWCYFFYFFIFSDWTLFVFRLFLFCFFWSVFVCVPCQVLKDANIAAELFWNYDFFSELINTFLIRVGLRSPSPNSPGPQASQKTQMAVMCEVRAA